jgi:DNA-binding NarL/FixJ family response regulator
MAVRVLRKVLRLMLVVDDPALREEARTALLRTEFGAVDFGTGSDLVARVGEVQPDLLLLDLEHPSARRLGVLEALTWRYPDMTVVVLSSDADPAQIRLALTQGAHGYLVKPFLPADLPELLRVGHNQKDALIPRLRTTPFLPFGDG